MPLTKAAKRISATERTVDAINVRIRENNALPKDERVVHPLAQEQDRLIERLSICNAITQNPTGTWILTAGWKQCVSQQEWTK